MIEGGAWEEEEEEFSDLNPQFTNWLSTVTEWWVQEGSKEEGVLFHRNITHNSQPLHSYKICRFFLAIPLVPHPANTFIKPHPVDTFHTRPGRVRPLAGAIYSITAGTRPEPSRR